jgi:hypothetical protein
MAIPIERPNETGSVRGGGKKENELNVVNST